MKKYDAYVNKIREKKQDTLESIRIMHDEIRKNALKVQRYEREEMGMDASKRLIEEERREKEVKRLTATTRVDVQLLVGARTFSWYDTLVAQLMLRLRSRATAIRKWGYLGGFSL